MHIHICYELGKSSDHAANEKNEVGIGSTFTLESIEVGFGQLLN